jgi:NAD(P)-dependent dehydrogenase (short-subunit alcohol dehydrogenase family)
MKDLEHRVAVVTGAASGIGRALSSRLAAEGARLVLSDVEAQALEEAVSEIEATGAEAIGIPTDVSDPEAVEALADAADRHFGAVHLLFANAGVMQDVGPAWERPLEDFAWVFGVNLWGPLHCVRSFVPRMLERGEGGHVVITASMSGLTVVPGNAAYQMSKHGAVALAETLYHELVDTPVGVSVLCPGYVETGITQSNRNRPEALRNEEAPPPRAMAGGWTGDATDALKAIAVPAADVADRVVRAIHDERFWILTHDNADARLRSRFDAILEGRNPSLDPSAPSPDD